MKYYVILIKTTNEKTTKSIYEFETEDRAVAGFHTELGKAMNDSNITECLCMAINSVGGIYKNECYKAEKEEKIVEE